MTALLGSSGCLCATTPRQSLALGRKRELLRLAQCRSPLSRVRAGHRQPPPDQNGPFEWEGVVANVGTWACAAALVFYAAQLSPNQTPVRDVYLIQQLVGLLPEADGLKMNTVLFDVFYLMGVYPSILASLLIPSARSSNKVPAWPFVSASFFIGVFGLLPYLCLWQPREDKTAPPSEADLSDGLGRFGLQLTESVWLPALLLVSAGGLLTSAFTAGIPQWNDYIKYFDESRFVHVMSLDFLALTMLTPLVMWWDADKREWPQRSFALPILSFLPLIGPCVYLMLRPRAQRPAALTDKSAAGQR